MEIEQIRKDLQGYHVEIMLYPTGGTIEATGCKECGSDDSIFECSSWKTHKGESISSAISKLKIKLGL